MLMALTVSIETDEGTVKLYLERLRGEDQALEWRFSRPTVGKIDRLYDEFAREPPFAKQLPPVFFSLRFLDAFHVNSVNRLEFWRNRTVLSSLTGSADLVHDRTRKASGDVDERRAADEFRPLRSAPAALPPDFVPQLVEFLGDHGPSLMRAVETARVQTQCAEHFVMQFIGQVKDSLLNFGAHARLSR